MSGCGKNSGYDFHFSGKGHCFFFNYSGMEVMRRKINREPDIYSSSSLLLLLLTAGSFGDSIIDNASAGKKHQGGYQQQLIYKWNANIT